MRKLITVTFALISIVLLLACTSFNKGTMKIKAIELTEEENNILKLVGADSISKVFDYTVDERAKSIHINCYILDDHNKWKEHGSSISQVKDFDGRIAISKVGIQGFRIAFQDKNGVNGWTTASEIYNNDESKASALSWLQNSDITYGKEISLAIQIVTSSNKIITYDTESFYDTERLKEHDVCRLIQNKVWCQEFLF